MYCINSRSMYAQRSTVIAAVHAVDQRRNNGIYRFWQRHRYRQSQSKFALSSPKTRMRIETSQNTGRAQSFTRKRVENGLEENLGLHLLARERETRDE